MLVNTPSSVLRSRKLKLEVGMVLARDGAWDRKYEVTHITKVDEDDETPTPRGVRYAVCLRYLGHYYADGRSKPSPKRPEREELYETYHSKDESGLSVREVYGYRLDRKWDGSRLKN